MPDRLASLRANERSGDMGLSEGWNRVTAAKGGVLGRERTPPKYPPCQGDARWDDQQQAEYVAAELGREFGTTWAALPHDDHFHVREIG